MEDTTILDFGVGIGGMPEKPYMFNWLGFIFKVKYKSEKSPLKGTVAL